MSFKVSNFVNNDDIKTLDQEGAFTVIEYQRDLSVSPETAETAYYAAQMNVRKRQVICDLATSPVTLQAGAMQWMVGNVNCVTGVRGVGDMVGKIVKGAVSSESVIKPEYQGNGIVVTEPTYKHLILINTYDWDGGLVLDDGLFLACESHLEQTIQARSNISSAVAGGHGLFNFKLLGTGVVVLESECPQEELVTITLNNDTLKIDGNYAIAWSGSLKFTVERAGKSLIGSAASGEGLTNVYRGTGKVMMMPTTKMPDV